MTIISEPPKVTTEEGIEVSEHVFDAAGAFVRVSRADGEPWRLEIDTVDTAEGSDVAVQNAQARAVRAAADHVLRLNKPKRSGAADDAISAEVRALIADRDWKHQDAAARFGMTASRLSALLNGLAHWTLTDLLGVGDGLSGHGWDAVLHLGQIGLAAREEEAGR